MFSNPLERCILERGVQPFGDTIPPFLIEPTQLILKMANIYDSDIRRITDALERDEDWRALVQSFPYELRDKVEKRVMEEHEERCRFRSELKRFYELPEKEQERRYIKNDICNYKVENDFLEKLKRTGRLKVIEARKKEDEKKHREWQKKYEDSRDREEREWKQRLPLVVTLVGLVIAVSAYILYQAWFPTWGNMATPGFFLKTCF